MALSAVLAALMAGPAHASTATVIDVFPGPNAIQSALAQANPGDTLNIHTGTYAENVAVDVGKVRLQAAGDGPVTVDGQCQGTTIDVRANGVTIEHLTIIGGDFFNLNFMFVGGAVASYNTLERTCPNAEYGINLYSTGAIALTHNKATGFLDAGIYIGSITDTGRRMLIALANKVIGNNRGIIVEDSFGVPIVVRGNIAQDNVTDGIWVHNADGINLHDNRVENNGFGGIELTAGSDNNTVRHNSARGHTYDLANGGSSNCFTNNTYTTSFGPITC